MIVMNQWDIRYIYFAWPSVIVWWKCYLYWTIRSLNHFHFCYSIKRINMTSIANSMIDWAPFVHPLITMHTWFCFFSFFVIRSRIKETNHISQIIVDYANIFYYCSSKIGMHHHDAAFSLENMQCHMKI